MVMYKQQQQQHKLYLDDYNYVVTVLQCIGVYGVVKGCMVMYRGVW